MARKNVSRIVEAARTRLGFEALLPGQLSGIRSVLDGHDTLLVMPTGGGKSAVYQIAGALLDGATVVVSPLLALQRDQVHSIDKLDVGDAVQVNSTVTAAEKAAALDDVARGRAEFLLLSPEQLARPEILAKLKKVRPSLFVVDEAHCVSEWGHDFRPALLGLGAVIEELGRPTVLALTATAAPPVREEIVRRLRMRDAQVIVRGFARPNIRLDVRTFADRLAKREALVAHVEAASGAGIVYVASRKASAEVAAALVKRGVRAAAYHAGLAPRERLKVERAFRANTVRVVVATSAFGMGIDKPDVRFVFHLDASASLDAYYQEIGRGGRDGAPARAVLFYAKGDLAVQRFLTTRGVTRGEDVRRVARARRRGRSVDELATRLDLSVNRVKTALALLEDGGSAAEIGRSQDLHREHTKTRIEMVRQYAEGRACLRAALLSYFGEEAPERCDGCGNCASADETVTDAGPRPFPATARVRHPKWGSGTVLRYEGDNVIVLFDAGGYRTLAVSVVIERRLLAPESDAA